MLRGSWFGSVVNAIDPTTGASDTKFGSGDDLYRGVALGGEVRVRAGESRLAVGFGWRPVREPFSDIVEMGVRLRF
ncbi:MAG: hypothetical protein E6K81_15585 [Candidatus Eisenbacteria bacterium]|uniref:Uncharacterized protein n=1 Tax=Eiseniibacteriota bacterium TaxID=2212470 RepID=A0A538TZS0_UNCEI|nr:MAG: hypothetical protein E6K81_15585 [Candidatus Eisenbacteria bacterium]